MSEAAEPATSSTNEQPTETSTEDGNGMEKSEEFGPEAKRRKTALWDTSKSHKGKSDKLEKRLGGILCCAVCLDLPIAAVYQVCRPSKSGILMFIILVM